MLQVAEVVNLEMERIHTSRSTEYDPDGPLDDEKPREGMHTVCIKNRFQVKVLGSTSFLDGKKSLKT